jgi:hypothetical protein
MIGGASFTQKLKAISFGRLGRYIVHFENFLSKISGHGNGAESSAAATQAQNLLQKWLDAVRDYS